MISKNIVKLQQLHIESNLNTSTLHLVWDIKIRFRKEKKNKKENVKFDHKKLKLE